MVTQFLIYFEINMNKWSIKTIKAGFEQFIEEHGRLPTAPEIDSADYLPSARTIQRSFGGVEAIRKQLGYEETHFGKGKYRELISLNAYTNGLRSEHEMEIQLIKRFGEPFVHIEKRVGEKKNRVDFYVYSSSGNFAVDIFYPQSFRDLQKNVNIKITKFVDLDCPMIYLVAKNEFEQTKIDKWVSNKKKEMPKNTHIFTLETFEKFLNGFKPYQDPTK